MENYTARRLSNVYMNTETAPLIPIYLRRKSIHTFNIYIGHSRGVVTVLLVVIINLLFVRCARRLSPRGAYRRCRPCKGAQCCIMHEIICGGNVKDRPAVPLSTYLR